MHKQLIHVTCSALLIAAALAPAPGCTKTETRVNDAHRDFKREVAPAADWVDEKANKAADEGKKAASKTEDAVDGDDGAAEPEKK